MHVLYIHQHFAIPAGSTGTRSYEFARRWVRAGHKVTVISGRYDIGGIEVPPGLIRKVNIEGIDVILLGAAYSNKLSFARRLWAFLSFAVLSCLMSIFVDSVDVVYATSTPLTIGIPALIVKFFRRIPYVFEVRDEWPEIPIQMGILKNPVMIKTARWLERTIYKNSSGIVALSPGMAAGVKSRLGNIEKTITVVPNSSDLEVFSPEVDGQAIRQRHRWHDRFVVLHFGAMGKANGLDFVLDAAEKVHDDTEILFVLAGGGSEYHRLKEQVKQRGLSNVELTGWVAKKQLPEYVAACDVSIVVFANYPILEHNSANKFFDSLSAAKPVLLNYSGWQRRVIEKKHAGLGCDLCNLEDFVAKLRMLKADKPKRQRMGTNARTLAQRQFSRDVLANKVLKLMQEIFDFGSNGSRQPH